MMRFLRATALRWRMGLAVLCLTLVTLISSCTPYREDYFGTWVGLDEYPANFVVYEYFISDSGNDSTCSVKVIRRSYELNEDRTAVVWTESLPHYFPGVYSDDGTVRTAFGVLSYEISSGNLLYNGIRFTKKARNTEIKLQQVARSQASRVFPDLPIED